MQDAALKVVSMISYCHQTFAGKRVQILVLSLLLVSFIYNYQLALEYLGSGDGVLAKKSLPGATIGSSSWINGTDFLLYLPQDGPNTSIETSLQDEMPKHEFDQLKEKCPITGQVLIRNNDFDGAAHESRRDANDAANSWQLETLDVFGNLKTIGGDEFYVTFTDLAAAAINKIDNTDPMGHPTAVAEITDLQNGRYSLKFISSPLNHHRHKGRTVGKGYLTVTLQYTCGIGAMSPPTKNGWKSGGHMVVRQWTTSIPIPSPHIYTFEPPKLHPNAIVDLSQYNDIVPFGDSLMKQFMTPILRRRPRKQPQKESPLSIKKLRKKQQPKTILRNIGMPLNSTTLSKWIQKLDERFPQPGNALLVDSHTWDLLESDNTGGLEDHGQALRQFVGHVRKWYPNVTLIWKGPTAMHIHSPILPTLGNHAMDISSRQSLLNRVRYMSSSRSLKFYHYQKQLCHELGVPFLDMYQASYLVADHTEVGDGRHFQNNVNTMMAHWFMKFTYPELQWRRYLTTTMANNQESTNNTLFVTLPNNDNNPSGCQFLEDQYLASLVNWAIVALLSNQELKLWPGTPVCTGQIDSKFFASNYDSSAMKRTVSKWATPLTLESLLELEEYIPSDLAREMFSQGIPFLHGMILSDLLLWPNVTKELASNNLVVAMDDESGSIANLEDASKWVVVAVHGNQHRKEELGSCIADLGYDILRPLRDLRKDVACAILYPSRASALEWQQSALSKSDIHYNCSAVIVRAPAAPAETALPGTDTEEGDHRQATPLLKYAQVVARYSHDGLVVSPSSEIFASLVHYLRFAEARKRGRLPVNRNRAAECVFNGSKSWGFH